MLMMYLNSWWLPALSFIVLLSVFTAAAFPPSRLHPFLTQGLFYLAGIAFCGVIGAAVWNLAKKRWVNGIINALLSFGCGLTAVAALALLAVASLYGPSEDGFADDLAIPEGIEVAEPDGDAWNAAYDDAANGTDELQDTVRKALAVPGGEESEFKPYMPSLRGMATDHAEMFLDYVAVSPDWHVFMERGNRFASRRWSYDGEPRDTLHGYISGFREVSRFQTRCLLCLDREQWGRYAVQQVEEGAAPVSPVMDQGNGLHESRVMIKCGGVWVEIFEQSDTPERRITKATVNALEREFSEFVMDPEAALAEATSRSRELASRFGGDDNRPFRLLTGMQPGIYEVAYSLNPGEPGWLYLRAYEVTKGTPLSVDRLERASKTRMAWSSEPSERFATRAGFTVYEGDWGKPYAARFEVWFKPDSGKPERKLAERVFKIEGWQR